MKYETMRLSLFSHVITVQNINEKTVANSLDWFFLTKGKKDTLDALKQILSAHFEVGNKDHVEITITQWRTDEQR